MSGMGPEDVAGSVPDVEGGDDSKRLFGPPSEHSRQDDDPPPVARRPVPEQEPARPDPGERPLFARPERSGGDRLFGAPQTSSRRAPEPAAPPAESGRAGRTVSLGSNPPPPGNPLPAPVTPAPGGPPPGAQPPGIAQAAPAQRTPGNRFVGQVDGKVSVALDSRGLPGVRVLVIAALLTGLLLVGRWALDSQDGLPLILRELTLAVLVVAALVLLIEAGFGLSTAALLRTFSEAGRGNPDTERMRFRDLRGRDPRWPRTTTAVVRFRLRTMTGELVSCVLRGTPDGEEIRAGDYLLAEGRRRRNGDVVVRRAEVLQGPAGPSLRTVRVRQAGGAVVVTVADWLCLAAGVAVFLWGLVEVLGR